MAKQGPQKLRTATEVLEFLKFDAENTICVSDASSEDENRLHPEDTHEDSDHDYCLPSLERYEMFCKCCMFRFMLSR